MVRFLWSFEAEWRANEELLAILLCVVLFDADRQGLHQPESVLARRDLFLRLLRYRPPSEYYSTVGCFNEGLFRTNLTLLVRR